MFGMIFRRLVRTQIDSPSWTISVRITDQTSKSSRNVRTRDRTCIFGQNVRIKQIKLKKELWSTKSRLILFLPLSLWCPLHSEYLRIPAPSVMKSRSQRRPGSSWVVDGCTIRLNALSLWVQETCAAKGKEGKMNGKFFVRAQVNSYKGTKMGSELFTDQNG